MSYRLFIGIETSDTGNDPRPTDGPIFGSSTSIPVPFWVPSPSRSIGDRSLFRFMGPHPHPPPFGQRNIVSRSVSRPTVSPEGRVGETLGESPTVGGGFREEWADVRS